MNTRTMASRMELMNDQLAVVTGGLMNSVDYARIKIRIAKSSLSLEKQEQAMRMLDFFYTKEGTFFDSDTVLTYLHRHFGNF